MNNTKEFFKKKILAVNLLKRETFIIEAVIKSEAVILKRGNFELGFYKSVRVSD